MNGRTQTPPRTPPIVLGYQAQDHRASLAQAARREETGDTVDRCLSCRCELDVAVTAHGIRCEA